MATPSGSFPFRFTLMPRAAQQMRAFARLSRQRGLSAEFAHDMDTIQDRLRIDPEVWGDPLFNYHHLQLTHYRGMSAFLFTYYSVNFPARQVFVQDFVAVPFAALA